MGQQSKAGFGVAHPVAYSPKNEEKKTEEKSSDDQEYQSLEEALLGE